MKRYWLQRISNEWWLSSLLLDRGYLSIGWRYLMKEKIPYDKDETTLKAWVDDKVGKNRSRFGLLNFCRFKKDDVVLVPLYDGKFSVYRIDGSIVEPKNLPAEIHTIRCDDNRYFKISEEGFFDFTDEVSPNKNYEADVGLCIKVEPLKIGLSRSVNASNPLNARMKIRQANADISDLEEDIEKAISGERIAIYEDVIEELSGKLIKQMKIQLKPDMFERLIEWYFKQIGATDVYIPSKNEPGKKNHADADIIATFEKIKAVVYIQAKLHDGLTDQWAVEQIYRYNEQFGENLEEYTTIPWVVSTAEFSEEAKELAKEKQVRLINGMTFAKMLLDAGIENIDECIVNK